MYNIKCKVFSLQFIPVLFVMCIFSVYFTAYTEKCTEILQLSAIQQSYPLCVCEGWEREREISVHLSVCLYFRHEVHSWTLCHHAVGIQVQQVGV